jgi:protein tyrosine phosphatase (PTP) superfamily phosphohydrolase (DUF442 family)
MIRIDRIPSKRRALAIGISLSLVVSHLSCGDREDHVESEKSRHPDNFHVVEEGRLYRSAQPEGDQLAHVIAEFGIKTVLNLRGPNAGEPWYDAETATCSEKGVTQVDIPFSARSLPQPDDLKKLIDTLHTAEYPMLLHCKAGADRSGLASALYELEVRGKTREEAMDQLTLQYMHFAAFAPCMDRFIQMYEPGNEWMAEYERTRDELTCVLNSESAPAEDSP